MKQLGSNLIEHSGMWIYSSVIVSPWTQTWWSNGSLKHEIEGVGIWQRVLSHSHRIRGRCLVPRPGNAVPIRGSGSKRVSVPFKVGSRPGLRGVAAPLLEDLIGIRRLLIEDWDGFCQIMSWVHVVYGLNVLFCTFLICLYILVSSLVAHIYSFCLSKDASTRRYRPRWIRVAFHIIIYRSIEVYPLRTTIL